MSECKDKEKKKEIRGKEINEGERKGTSALNVRKTDDI